jgi:GR25 family glycosyltransferase involved in LPS biosynthesis
MLLVAKLVVMLLVVGILFAMWSYSYDLAAPTSPAAVWTVACPPPSEETIVQPFFSMKCINLPKSDDRRDFIQQQVEASDFVEENWSFEEAIDGQKLSSGGGRYCLLDGSIWNYKIPTTIVVDPLVLGCTLSHLKAITSIQSTYCLVIEDDTFLSLSYLQKDGQFDIDRLVQEAPEDWGIIQLGCNQRCTQEFRPWVSADRMYGTYAYLISKACADEIHSLVVHSDGSVHVDPALSGEIYLNADFFLYGLVNVSTNFRAYTHTVFSTYNNDTTMDSTLHPESTNRHRRATADLIQELLENRFSLSLTPPSSFSTSSSTTQTRELLTTEFVDASLCIPCHFGHMKSLRILLLSMQLQSVLTREIVVSVSSAPSDMDADRLKLLLQPLVPDCPLRLSVTQAVQYAGMNRNVCIEQANYDILIFIDADDLMHSNRIQVTYDFMAGHPTLACLLHSYTRPNTPAWTGKYTEMMGRAIYDLNMEWVGSTSTIMIPATTQGFDGFGVRNKGFKVHNGHPVLRRSRLVEKNIRYTHDRRGQDAIFNRTLLLVLGRRDDTMAFVNTPLTYYLQDNSSVNFHE